MADHIADVTRNGTDEIGNDELEYVVVSLEEEWEEVEPVQAVKTAPTIGDDRVGR
jgi:hypothetical protein